MEYYENVSTTDLDYTDKCTENITIWRNARIVNTYAEKSVIGDGAYCKDSTLEENVMLNRYSFCLHSHIGKHTQIGFNSKLFFCNVGKYCSISWDCSVGGPNHNMHSVSTFVFDDPKNLYEKKSLLIGNDVWIGAGSIILRGITVGDGAVIAAGAVVTKDVLPYEIVGEGASKTS